MKPFINTIFDKIGNMKRIQKKIKNIRTDYHLFELDEKLIKRNPFDQFQIWMNDALKKKVIEPNAMNLSTAKNGRPSSRIVLLRGFDKKGFEFYTNYESRKGIEIEGNSFAALTFFWPELARQVRIEGELEKVSAKKSDAYFKSRPRNSQLSAWASHQGKEIENRDELMSWYEFFEEKFKGKKVPRPTYWGGYILNPNRLEFWQGRQNRLHDRILYVLQVNNKWDISRLSP